jgi:hypothetical protein
MAGKRPSKRFLPTAWTERLVPLLLALLLLILAATVIFVLLSVLGVVR